MVVLLQLLHQDSREVVIHIGPNVDDLVITLIIGNITHIEVVHNLGHLVITFLDELLLLLRNDYIRKVE